MISEKTIAKFDRIALRAHKAGFKAAKAKAREIVRENKAEIVVTSVPGKTYVSRAIGLPYGDCYLYFASARSGFFQYLKEFAYTWKPTYIGPCASFRCLNHRLWNDEPVHPKHRYLVQSLEVNRAYYGAVVEVLNKAGIDCSFWWRVD